MKFSTDCSELLDAIRKTGNTLSGVGTQIPALTGVLLGVEDDSLAITWTNLEETIVTKVDVRDAVPGRVVVPKKEFVRILDVLPSGNVNFDADGERILIRSGSGRFEFDGMPATDYPEISLGGKGVEIETGESARLGEMFSDLIGKTTFACGSDESRPSMTGVLMELRDGKLKLTATDGKRAALAWKKVPIESECRIIVAARAMNDLQRLLVEETLRKVVVGDRNVEFVLGQTTLNSILLEGEYPEVDNAVPKSNETKVVFDVEDFSAAIRRVAVLSEEESYPITFTFREGEVELRGKNKMLGGEAEETLAIEYRGKEFRIRLNASYVLPVLTRIGGSAVFEFKDSGSAVLIRPGEQLEGEDYLCAVMPINLPETESA